MESRVGAASFDEVGADLSVRPGQTHRSAPTEDLPFARADILNHLRSARERITATLQQRSAAGEDDISESLARAVALLDDLEKSLRKRRNPTRKNWKFH